MFMKQEKIALWLKGLVIGLAILGAIFLIGFTIFAFARKDLNPVTTILGFPFAVWYSVSMCYVILFHFWHVCQEISRENSFSMENARSFHKMAIGGILLGSGFLVKLGLVLFGDKITFLYGLFIVFEIIVSIAFVIVCETLSKLILHAYEMKQENDLTI